MEKSSKEKLEELFLKREQRTIAIAENSKLQKNRRDEFQNKFEDFANSVIKPIMNEIGDFIKDNGHDYQITYDRNFKNSKGVTLDTRITMDIFPNGHGRGDSFNVPAHILFKADVYEQKVLLHENTIVPHGGGGVSGPKGRGYSIDELTPQIVEKEIVDSIGKIIC